jgi:hypothetical protein
LGGPQKSSDIVAIEAATSDRCRYECHREAWKVLGPILNRSKAHGEHETDGPQQKKGKSK